MTDLKAELLAGLRSRRAVMLAKLDGLSEYDRRRPLTPTGTNLLGLVKHLAGLEYGYFGDALGRHAYERPSWFRDDPSTELMWATPDESTDYITGVYQKASAHSDATIADLQLDSPGHVAHWAEGHRETTLGVLLVIMVGETAQHAGHADIIRELIDGRIGTDGSVTADPTFWRDQLSGAQAAADYFRPTRDAETESGPAERACHVNAHLGRMQPVRCGGDLWLVRVIGVGLRRWSRTFRQPVCRGSTACRL